VQQDSLQQKNKPIVQMDEVIEGIRKMILESVEESLSTRKMDEREPTQAVGMMQEQKKQSSGAKRQLQEKVWDPGGFQPCQRAHDFSNCGV
jgi:hypothetical protein